jgi:uncharacterized membrane protein YeiH
VDNGLLIELLDYFGTAVFALSGVLLASRRRMDPFGAFVLASVTAIGGGTMRDIALGDTPVFWVHNAIYLWVIMGTCLVSMILLNRFPKPPQWLLPVADAIGMAVFMAIGAKKAAAFDVPIVVAIVMGVMTACGGGMIRDILANRIPLVLRSEIYATACIVGGIFWGISNLLGLQSWVGTAACIVTALAIRLVAIRYHLALPRLIEK